MSDTEQLSPDTQKWWNRRLAAYKPNNRKAFWQVVNTYIPYAITYAAMVYMVVHDIPYWIVLLVAVIAAGLLMRIFIIFHDCGHGNFSESRKVNDFLWNLSGILTFTPPEEWRSRHAAHHVHVGNLDKRGMGDVDTMTVEEFKAASLKTQILYRIYRNPVVLFVIGPAYLFIIHHRFWHKSSSKKARKSVIVTNLWLLVLILFGCWVLGPLTFVKVQLPIIWLAAIFGVWLFYVQHQYEDTYWRKEEWDPVKAALQGSSYYKLPKVLQWFSGNIGFHHIHHLKPYVPNYDLPTVQKEVEELHGIKPMTLRTSLQSMFVQLWDEESGKMVNFRSLKKEYLR